MADLRLEKTPVWTLSPCKSLDAKSPQARICAPRELGSAVSQFRLRIQCRLLRNDALHEDRSAQVSTSCITFARAYQSEQRRLVDSLLGSCHSPGSPAKGGFF